ncbi:hypothetical protein D3Z52_20750 [Clostridiaceae bacterium]|nr:hypothetical protein [Clostridiaceae bacterium]
MSKKSNVYVCRKLFLYYFLTEQGFEPFANRPDKFDCKKRVWLYNDSSALRDAVDDFYANKPANL